MIPEEGSSVPCLPKMPCRGRVKTCAAFGIGWRGDTSPQNGCCRALESTAGELAESKADRRFAALSGAGTAL